MSGAASTFARVPRLLTDREKAVLTVMIERGDPVDAPGQVTADRRRRWLTQVPKTYAGRRCNCGTCPSIHLENEQGDEPQLRDRIVLEGSCDGGLILLFVDDDQLSYLELAPVEVDRFDTFPPVEAVYFGDALPPDS